MNTKHSTQQSQRRGILPIAVEALDRYGQEQYDGNGAIIVYMNKASRRAMERDWGHRAVAKLWELLNDVYKVVSTDGKIITVGHRYKKIQRA
ncbi:hypothetical protein [Rhodoferax sp.]|uniref:hypothetical protein n=1 Tax=Rhodoferax sp. TaxID=50421 RepID=UPI0025E74C90|nr:hypothetical protein [Rhodoferax sp.]MCM2341721.1 hypothetical protein [Rhodoferax sp.]